VAFPSSPGYKKDCGHRNTHGYPPRGTKCLAQIADSRKDIFFSTLIFSFLSLSLSLSLSFNRVSLGSPGWPQTLDPPASASPSRWVYRHAPPLWTGKTIFRFLSDPKDSSVPGRRTIGLRDLGNRQEESFALGGESPIQSLPLLWWCLHQPGTGAL
jgi:hypothetical protein